MGSGFGFRQSWLRRETLAIPEHLIIANILPSTALQRSLPPRLRTLKRCPALWGAGRSFGVAGFIAASSRKFMRFGLEIPGGWMPWSLGKLRSSTAQVAWVAALVVLTTCVLSRGWT